MEILRETCPETSGNIVYSTDSSVPTMKTSHPLVLLTICLATACSRANTNEAVTENIFNAFNAHDWRTMLENYAGDAVFEDPAFARPVRDHSIMEDHHRQLQIQFPDIHDSIQSISAYRDRVIVEFVSTGTSLAGERFRLPICTVLTFKDGKVVRDATYYSNCPQ
jgi:ketosteroid isomerase-like protein